MNSFFHSQDSFGDKISRELGLLSAAGQGIVDAGAEAWQNKGESALKIGGGALGGAALALVSNKAGLLGKVILAGSAVSFGLELARRGTDVAGAVVETWSSGDRFAQNKKLVGDSIGTFLVDGVLMSAGGYAGARITSNSTVNAFLKKGVGEVQARLPSAVVWREERLLDTLASYHPGTAQHSRRVGSLSKEIAKELGLSTRQKVVSAHAGKMHDIGKLETPKQILMEDGHLTAAERAVMEQHTAHTYTKLEKLNYPQRLAETPKVAAGHHENIDGSGYHRGLKGDEVTIEMRVLKVADEWDALTQPRDYKGRWPIPTVQSALQEEVAAGHIDGKVLNALYHVPAAKVLKIMNNGTQPPNTGWLRGVSLQRFLDVAAYGLQQRAGDPSFRSILDFVYKPPTLNNLAVVSH
ncbi:MAG: HD domain-containing protein [Candidatus Obscuribacterales bacterium]|nr:HD domain-containing protein [Candidatus Obscuribacterales bacterium]